MPFDKLYVKIKCPLCNGTRQLLASAHHDPGARDKWKSCPYCDHNGHQLIEAVGWTVVEHIMKLPEDKRDLIIDEVQKLIALKITQKN